MNINWLNEVLPIHGIKLTDDMLTALDKYKSLVLSWNEKMNLTAITKEDEFLEKHFFDSIMAANSQYFKGKKSFRHRFWSRFSRCSFSNFISFYACIFIRSH